MCTICGLDHRPGFTFRMPGTSILVDTEARCHRCRGTEHLIGGEGVVVCWSCLNLLAETTADPLIASPECRRGLVEFHGDIVALREVAGAAVFEWVWTAAWPDVKDFRLVGGGVAA